MDLFIQTLTGTTFELRVSPFETIMSIKAKIQRLEGIPIAQQHLIWRTGELEDDFCLHDYNICDGATLKLVLAMRGGPINTRRIPMEDPTLREMAEYMEANRDEIWDKLPKDNRQVTLLVFRDGDQLNFFRVVDRGDGTLTPLSDSLSGASMYNLYDEEEEENQPPISQETLQENNVTMNKMKLLRHRMLTQRSGGAKPKMQPRPPSGDKPSSSLVNTRRRLHLSSGSPKKGSVEPLTLNKPHSKPLIPHPPSTSEAGMAHGSSVSKSKDALPPVNTKKGKQIDVSDFLAHQQEPKVLNRTLTRSAFREGRRSITEFVNESKEIKPLGSISKSKGRGPSPRFDETLEHSLGSGSIRRSKIPEDVGISYRGDLQADSAGYRRTRVGLEARIPTPEGHHSTLLNDSLSYSYRHLHDGLTELPPSHHLPPMKPKPPPQLVPTKKKTRCFFCGKKTGLATTYQCRCGNSFCATHRYAEVHSCTYDYKSEGRKIIEQNNPVIAAPKLPKI